MEKNRTAKLHKLIIREEYRQLVLPPNADMLQRMEEQIRRFGCQAPVPVWGGRVLVDFERYEIFHRLQIPFIIINNPSRDSAEVIEWICRNQLQRTDLTNQMRRYLIGRQFLMLKLLGAHCAASTPQPAGKKGTFARKLKYEPSPIRIRETLGTLYHIRQETVERYAAYAKAVDFTRIAAPDLAAGLLSGRCKLTFERTLELTDKTPAEILELDHILKNGADPVGRDAALTALFSPKQREPEIVSLAVPPVSVKDMPSYDPDAEISSLTLTIPAWTKSIQRVNASSDFRIISGDAKNAARRELIRLKNAVEELLHSAKGVGRDG